MEGYNRFSASNKNNGVEEVSHSNLVDNSFREIINYKLSSQKKMIGNCPKVLVDASLIIDVLLDRHSIHLENAIKIMDYVISKKLNGYITEVGLKDIWEITKKLKGEIDANYMVLKLLNSFNVCIVEREMILNVQRYHLNSFETGIQVECVRKYQIDAIITLRYKDFLECGFENFFSPHQFIESYDANNRKLAKLDSTKTRLNHSLTLDLFTDTVKGEDRLLLFDGWEIEHFDLTCSKSSLSSATVVIVNKEITNKQSLYSESAFGVGATATLFSAFDKVIRHIVDEPNYILDSIKVSNIEKGVEGSVMADIVVKSENQSIRKYCIHRNVIKACFYSYIEAVKLIYNCGVNHDTYNLLLNLSPVTKVSEEEVLGKYNLGVRNFAKTNLEHTNFVGVNLSGIDLSYSSLSSSNLDKINLSNANLTEAFLKKAIITNANLSKAILCKAKLNDSILRDSRLNYAEIIKADLTGANLIKADLSNVDLTGANLIKADLSNVNLTGANLTGVNLSNANLTGANLTGVNLSNANLTSANFTNTIVDRANFSEANLSRTDLTTLDLRNTIFCKPVLTDTAMPDIKVEIYGKGRIEGMIILFSQFENSHYEIYAVHSNAYGAWWNKKIGKQFIELNRKLSEKGIPIKRVFIIPKNNDEEEVKTIIKEQIDLGIEVRCLSEEFAENFDGFNLRNTNLLVCRNLSVEKNSFTTMMIFDEKEKKEISGYISFKKDELQINEQRFNMIWEKAEMSSSNLCDYGTQIFC